MAEFYSVGVGAGDGSYITLGALRVLEKAQVIAVPVKKSGEKSTALEIIHKEFDTDKKEILELEFPMSSDSLTLAKAHKKTADKIIETLSSGKSTAMITLGDVSIYSTCSYVHDAVKNAGYEIKIIPGIPSFCAAADKAGVSLCERDETLAVVPAVNMDDSFEKILDTFDNIVVMKAGKSIDKIYDALKKRGLQNNAVVASNVNMDGEFIGKITPSGEYGYFTTVIIKKNLS